MLTFNGDRWASRTSRSLSLAAGLANGARPIALATSNEPSPATLPNSESPGLDAPFDAGTL